MRVCDRCRQDLDTNKGSKLNGVVVELCSTCADHILNHIKNYRPKTQEGIAGKITKAITGK